MKSRIMLLSAVVATVTVFAASTANATHSWGNYHWERTANPVSLSIGDNVSSDWDTYLGVAITDWDASDVLELAWVSGEGGRRCKASAGRIEVCDGSYGNNGWLGLASISVSGNHITAATTKLNDTYFSSGTYNTPAWRQMVLCQEIGHTFGLDHQDETFDNPNLDTCMDYTSDPESNQHPNQHDYDQLDTIYAHLDSASSGGGGFCPGRKKSCASGKNGLAGSDTVVPGEWGQLVHAQGRQAVYERDFGNGNRVVTFVIWAD